MGKQKNPIIEEAEKLFKKGYKLITISKELNIPEGTIRSWKNRYKWGRSDSATLQKKNNKKRNVAKEKGSNENNEESILDEIKGVIENEALSDKQRLFCVIYAKCMNATKAYLKAYTCTYESAMVNGSRLLGNDKIKQQIDKLIGTKCNKEFLSRSVIQKYIDIAFSDITDYVTFGQEEHEVKDADGKTMYDEDGTIVTRKYSYVKPNESIRVDGTLITEVSQGRDGIKIKLADKMKALEFLTKHCNLLSDEEKIKLDIENKKLQNNKIKAEITKITGEDEPEVEDDGFMEALKGRTTEVWKNE